MTRIERCLDVLPHRQPETLSLRLFYRWLRLHRGERPNAQRFVCVRIILFKDPRDGVRVEIWLKFSGDVPTQESPPSSRKRGKNKNCLESLRTSCEKKKKRSHTLSQHKTRLDIDKTRRQPNSSTAERKRVWLSHTPSMRRSSRTEWRETGWEAFFERKKNCAIKAIYLLFLFVFHTYVKYLPFFFILFLNRCRLWCNWIFVFVFF